MASTNDPDNFVQESLRTHLRNNMTDPLGSTLRESNNFIVIGFPEDPPQFPFVRIQALAPDEAPSQALGQQINSSEEGITLLYQVTFHIFATEDEVSNSMAGDRLCRNIGGDLRKLIKKKSHLATLKGSYDIEKIVLTGGQEPFRNQEDGVWQYPMTAELEFLWRIS